MSERALLEIDTDAEVEKVIQQLNRLPDKIAAPSVLKKAIKTTAQKTRRQLIKDAKARYALADESGLKDKSKGAPTIVSGKGATVSSTIQSKGPMQDIMAFMTRPNTETGAAAAKILNSSGEKSLEMNGLKAFVTQFASGHVAIVQRKGKKSLPVKKLLSPAVPHLLGNEEVRAEAEKMAWDTLQKQIEKQINKVNAARA